MSTESTPPQGGIPLGSSTSDINTQGLGGDGLPQTGSWSQALGIHAVRDRQDEEDAQLSINTGDSDEGAEETEETSGDRAATEEEEAENVPFNNHPRFKQVIAEKNEAKAAVAAKEAAIADLQAKLDALTPIQQDFEAWSPTIAQYKAQGFNSAAEYTAAMEAQANEQAQVQSRKEYIATEEKRVADSLIEQRDKGEISPEYAEYLFMQQRETIALAYDNQRLSQQIQQQATQTAVQMALLQYPDADPQQMQVWIQAGYEPKSTAQYLHAIAQNQKTEREAEKEAIRLAARTEYEKELAEAKEKPAPTNHKSGSAPPAVKPVDKSNNKSWWDLLVGKASAAQ